MQEHLTTTNEDDPTQAVLGFREFDDEELSQLEKKGISAHHLARFLEALRNNLDPSSLRRFLSLLDESQEQDQCPVSYT